MGTGGYGEDAPPPIAHHVVTPTFQPNEEEVALAIPGVVPITRRPAGPEDLVNVDPLSRLSPTENQFPPHPPAKHLPKSDTVRLDSRQECGRDGARVDLMAIDHADEDEGRTRQHLVRGHI